MGGGPSRENNSTVIDRHKSMQLGKRSLQICLGRARCVGVKVTSPLSTLQGNGATNHGNYFHVEPKVMTNGSVSDAPRTWRHFNHIEISTYQVSNQLSPLINIWFIAWMHSFDSFDGGGLSIRLNLTFYNIVFKLMWRNTRQRV